MDGCFYLKYYWEKRNGVDEKIYHRCNFAHGLRVIRFYNPDDLKDCRDITLCEIHYREVFFPMTSVLAIAESRVSSELKKIAQTIKDFRDRKDWDMLAQYRANPQIYQKRDRRKKELQILQETCRHVDCENSTKGRARQLFSITIMNQRGGSEGKLNFCSFNCWNKIRKYIGIVRIAEKPKDPKTLESYM